MLRALKSVLVVQLSAKEPLFSPFSTHTFSFFLTLVFIFPSFCVFLSATKCSRSTINVGASKQWGGKARLSHYARPRFKQSSMLWFPSDVIVTRCSLSISSLSLSLLSLQWRVWTGARGGVSRVSQNLISLERELYASLYLFVHQLPQHTHTLCFCAPARRGVGHGTVPTCLDYRKEVKLRRQHVSKCRNMFFMRRCSRGSKKPQWLETNVEDCECFQGECASFQINGFKSSRSQLVFFFSLRLCFMKTLWDLCFVFFCIC